MSGQGTGSEIEESAFDGFDASTFVFAPPSATAPSPRELSQRRRVFVAVLVAHAFALIALLLPPSRDADMADPGLRVEFITIPATQRPTPPSPTPARVRPPPEAPVRPSRAVRPGNAALQAVEIAPRTVTSDVADAPAQPAVAARLFDDEGKIVLPEGAFEALQKNISDDRVFDYQIAGLAKAKAAFDRRPPLTYDRSRFEDGMVPKGDMLTELLERAVTATTLEIVIPIPGDPNRKIVCNIALLAMGGACGVEGFTGFVEEDDPDTLNPEEEKQCAAWWEKITTTGQQGVWLQTRALYDANCRKPPER